MGTCPRAVRRAAVFNLEPAEVRASWSSANAVAGSRPPSLFDPLWGHSWRSPRAELGDSGCRCGSWERAD